MDAASRTIASRRLRELRALVGAPEELGVVDQRSVPIAANVGEPGAEGLPLGEPSCVASRGCDVGEAKVDPVTIAVLVGDLDSDRRTGMSDAVYDEVLVNVEARR